MDQDIIINIDERNRMEKKYNELLKFGGLFTWDYDLKTRSIYDINSTNPLFDHLPGENIPFSIFEENMVSESEQKIISDFYDSLYSGIDEAVYEGWLNLTENSAPRYYRIKYIIEKDKKGQPIIAHGIGTELTETKNAEIAYINRANAFIRMSPNAIATFQVNLTYNTVTAISCTNPSLYEASRATELDDLIRKIVVLIYDKNERQSFISNFSTSNLLSQFNSGNFRISYEHHLYFPEFGDQWVSTCFDMIRNPSSGDAEAIAHIIDIHSRKTITGLVNGTIQREFDFIALCYIKSNNFIIVDKYSNNMTEKMHDYLSYFKNEFRRLIQSDEEYDKVASEFETDKLVENINRSGEYTIQFNTSTDKKRNKHKILRLSFLNLKKDIIIISCRDTTRLYNEELSQTEKLVTAIENAENANKAKSEFLSLVSHDLRTPLNGLIGMLDLASGEKDLDKIRSYLSKAKMSSDFLLGLINDILDLAKIEAGKIEFKNEIYSYKEFNNYINSIIRPICKSKNLHFSIHAQNVCPYLMVDKLRINQIIFNILSNACKYTKEGGNIQFKINAERLDQNLSLNTFIIKDDGIGMSKKFQEKLYDTFHQENRMNLRMNEGSGLGLSITHNLVEMMNGSIDIVSEENKGTTVTIKLKLPYFETIDENMVMTKNKENLPKVDFSGKHFLLCEDNEINQEIVVEILKNVGATVDVAGDGLTGLNLYKDNKAGFYSAVLMDIRMPVMDGLEASRNIRKCKKKDSSVIPIIAMTANAMSKDKMECIQAGMNAYISKPVNVNGLYYVIEEVMG